MKTSKSEVICMVVGAIVGAAPPLLAWELSGKFDPWNSLAWGMPYYFLAVPGGLIGAFIGTGIGGFINRHKKS